MAAAGDPGVKDRLLKGTKLGSKSSTVHLDGYNQLDFITGKTNKSARTDFYYFNDDGELVAMRWDTEGMAWKAVFCEQRAPGNLKIWSEPFTCLRMPKIYNLRMDPYERADITSDQYYDWVGKNAYLIGIATMKASEFLMTFNKYPPSQLPASFGVDAVAREVNRSIEEKLRKAPPSGRRARQLRRQHRPDDGAGCPGGRPIWISHVGPGQPAVGHECHGWATNWGSQSYRAFTARVGAKYTW